MTNRLHLHLLDARGALAPLEHFLRRATGRAFSKASGEASLGAVDVVIDAGTRVIPEKGHMGFCGRAGRLDVTVDPNNPALLENKAQSFERMIVHELNHSMRWEGPGYGTTLGEALVAEGLAGWFAQQIYGPPCEPWERVDAMHLVHRAKEGWDAPYDHGAWFFGSGNLPRWAGYTLGYAIVGATLKRSDRSPAQATLWPASDFRQCCDEASLRAEDR